MRARVVWSVAVGFLVGVFVASVTSISSFVVLATLSAALFSLAILFVSRLSPTALLVPLALCATVIGIVRMDAARVVPDSVLAEHTGEKISIEGVVSRESDVRERSVRLTVDTDTARLLVIAPAHAGAEYGDVIRVEGTLRIPTAFGSGDGRVFDYPQYLASRGITYEVAFAQVETIRSGEGNLAQSAAIYIKNEYLTGLRAVLPEPYAGLAGGITVGDKRSVGSELSEVFQSVSLVHILVLSGYNITIVLAGIARVLTRASRRTQLLLTGLVVIFFMLISGGAVTAVRAGMMAYLGVYARLSGRLFFAIRILVLVGCAMVLWNPYILVYDPGFQLSMLATLGLILFTPHFARACTAIPERFGFREVIASSIATQCAVLPLLLYQNGLLSIVALPANALTLVAVPFAMIGSGVAAIAGMAFGTWGTLLAFPAHVLLAYIVAVAETLARIPFAAVSVPAFSAWWLLVAYATMAGAYMYMVGASVRRGVAHAEGHTT